MTYYRFEGLGKEWVTIEAAAEIAALRERAEFYERESDLWQKEAVAVRERAKKAGKRVELLEAMQREILQHEEIEEPIKDGSENLASVVHNALDALRERADEAERKRDEFASQAVALEHQWSGTNAELEEAREDTKALAMALRTPWRSRSEAEAAWQRIRSRRLLEVSE